VSDFIELLVTLLPPEAGGRTHPVAPRSGTYRATVRSPHGERARVRFLEGPPQIAPGEAALVVAEVESESAEVLFAGDELDLVEPDGRFVGIVTLVRVWRAAVSA
jgi:hypothetical protein